MGVAVDPVVNGGLWLRADCGYDGASEGVEREEERGSVFGRFLVLRYVF